VLVPFLPPARLTARFGCLGVKATGRVAWIVGVVPSNGTEAPSLDVRVVGCVPPLPYCRFHYKGADKEDFTTKLSKNTKEEGFGCGIESDSRQTKVTTWFKSGSFVFFVPFLVHRLG
jgi:hypothetical protein